MASLIEIIDDLARVVEQPLPSDGNELKEVLRRQVHALDQLFNALGHRALSATFPTPQLEMLKVALRAQAQCAVTAKALEARASNPSPTATSVLELSDEELIAIAEGGPDDHQLRLE